MLGEWKLRFNLGAAFDGTYAYLHARDIGLLKVGTGAGGSTLARVYAHNRLFALGEKCKLVYLAGRLLSRSSECRHRAFVEIDRETLQEVGEESDDEVEDEAEEADRRRRKRREAEAAARGPRSPLAWTPAAEGRNLRETPLFTDGRFLYVVAVHKEGKKGEEKEEEGDDEAFEDKKLTLETWDAAGETKLREVDLRKSTTVNFVRGPRFLRRALFCTNGAYLIVFCKQKLHFFDVRTGLRLEKASLESPKEVILFDSVNHIFWSIDRESKRLSTFTMPAFKKFSSTGEGAFAATLTERIERVRTSLLTEGTPAERPSVLAALVHQGLEQIHSEQHAAPSSATEVAFLIRSRLCDGAKKFEQEAQTALQKVGLDGTTLRLFKFPFATFLTSRLFLQLASALERHSALLDSPKRSVDLLRHYNLYFLLRVLKANLIAMSACALKMSEILPDEAALARFISVFNATVARVVHVGFKEEFEGGADEEEMRMLWSQIYEECKSIVTYGLSLLYSSVPEILAQLQECLS